MEKKEIIMTKKLEIKFVKFEKALAIQVLNQEGSFKATEHVNLDKYPMLLKNKICISRYYDEKDEEINYHISCSYFNSNKERDEYIEKVVNWITEEQFPNKDNELKIGSECEVKNYDEDEWVKRKLITVLPKQYYNRYICESQEGTDRCAYNWSYARPISDNNTGNIKYVKDSDYSMIYSWKM